MDRLVDIKKKYRVPNEIIGWMILEIEQLRKALDDIDEEAINTYENSEAPELNDCIDRMQQIAIQVRKESK